jgi:hypothetical protein
VDSRDLRNQSGIPIRALRVGVNVSTDDCVPKAGVTGNLDIDRKSISHEWDKDEG